LKVQEETSSVLPSIEEVPVVPVFSEEVLAPALVVEADPVEPSPPSPVAEALATVELVPEVAPEPVKELQVTAEEPLGLVNEGAPEPTKEETSRPIVTSEAETPTEAPTKSETIPIETAAEPVEEHHTEPVPEASHEELPESGPAPVEMPEPSADASAAEAASHEEVHESGLAPGPQEPSADVSAVEAAPAEATPMHPELETATEHGMSSPTRCCL
jgi:hypothetical protein